MRALPSDYLKNNTERSCFLQGTAGVFKRLPASVFLRKGEGEKSKYGAREEISGEMECKGLTYESGSIIIPERSECK